jgi:Mg-chelatase subunit ChlD
MELILGDYGVEEAYLLLLILPIMLIFYRYISRGGMNRTKWFFLASRLLIITLIITAIAAPFITKVNREFKDISGITLLSDLSESMKVTDVNKDVTEKLYSGVSSAISNLTGKPASVELRYFSEGNRTAVGDALYQETLRGNKEKNLLVLLSDGNNNYGRDTESMAQILANSNITLLAVMPQVQHKDIYIAAMSGDKKTPANADYTLRIDVGKTGSGIAQYSLDLKVDDAIIHAINSVVQPEDIKTFTITFSVKDAGIHKITAAIRPTSEDAVRINNEMIKSVDVVERPQVLLVTGSASSLLSDLLKDNYDVTAVSSPTQDYSKYDVIYFDNVPGASIDSWVTNSLNEYIVDGNGLVVVGGDKSYERGGYHNKQIETLLPVIATEPPEKKRRELALIFLIDISESTGYGLGGVTKVSTEKAVAINIIRQLDDNDLVGAIAFNVGAYTISPLGRLGDKETDLTTRISSLMFTGGTDMKAALNQADLMLEGFNGKKYVIVISDGVLKKLAEEEPTLAKIKAMNDKGAIIYSVGVGFDTNEKFMQKIAEVGKGIYFKPEDYERLKIEFEDKDNTKKDQYKLTVANKYHFITRDLKNYYPSIKEFNGVTEKSVAQVLITTDEKMPVLTVWRFGLGRVVAFTVDNGLQWAPNAYYSNNGELISATTNWAIGDLEKRKRVNIQTSDVDFGDKATITIKSDKVADLAIQDARGTRGSVLLKQTDVNMFVGSFSPDAPGFYMIKAVSSLGEDTDAFAVNIPTEYRALGVNAAELNSLTKATGGRTYNTSQMNELEADLLDYTKETAYKETIEKTPLQVYLMAAALGLFFIDVISRRVLDIIRLRHKGE